MHELTLAASLLDLTEEHARKSGLGRVSRVYLALGALAPVDETALAFGFEIARHGTLAEAAELCIERVAGRASCSACGQGGETFEVEMRGEPCPTCGGFGWRLVEGGELRLTGLEGV